MTTLLDHIDGRAATDARPATADVTAPAQRLRATMAAVRLAVHLARHPEVADARAARPGRRGLRRRGPVPLAPARSCSTPSTRPSAPSPPSGARSRRYWKGADACRTPSRASG